MCVSIRLDCAVTGNMRVVWDMQVQRRPCMVSVCMYVSSFEEAEMPYGLCMHVYMATRIWAHIHIKYCSMPGSRHTCIHVPTDLRVACIDCLGTHVCMHSATCTCNQHHGTCMNDYFWDTMHTRTNFCFRKCTYLRAHDQCSLYTRRGLETELCIHTHACKCLHRIHANSTWHTYIQTCSCVHKITHDTHVIFVHIIHLHTCVQWYTYTYTYIYIYIYIYIRVYVCIYVYKYICILPYIYTQTHIWDTHLHKYTCLHYT